MLRGFASGKIFGEYRPGRGALIVFLHGWARTSEDFLAVTSQLADELEGSDRPVPAMLSLDLPGFGASPPPTQAIGSDWYAEMTAESVESVCREIGTSEVHLVGHSLGGRVIAHYAAAGRWPMSSVIFAGAPLLRLSAQSPVSAKLRFAKALAKYGLVSESRLDGLRDKSGSPDYRATSGVMRSVFVTLVNEDYRSYLAKIEVPTLFVSGSNDTAVPPKVAELASELVSNSRTVVLDGVDHFIPTHAPDRLAQLVANHILGAEL